MCPDIAHESAALLTSSDPIWVAPDGGDVVGGYRLHIRNSPAQKQAELLFLVASRPARQQGVDLLLVEHMAEQVAAFGFDRLHVVVMPPREALFVTLGAERVGLELCGVHMGHPRLRLSLRV